MSGDRRPPAPLAARLQRGAGRNARRRRSSTRDTLVLPRGHVPGRSRRPRPRDASRAARPRRRSTRPSSRSSRRSGSRRFAADERERLEGIWEDGILELAAAAGGRIVPLAVGRPRDGLRRRLGRRRPARRPRRSGAASLDASAWLRLPLRPSGLRVGPYPVRPTWWPALVDYTAQMQRAYFAWLAGGQAAGPTSAIVFAILAGGGADSARAPRLARRRRPDRPPPEPLLRHVVVRPAGARGVRRDASASSSSSTAATRRSSIPASRFGR